MVVAHMATGQAAVDSDPVAKCAKFFKTLINLTQQNQEKYTPNAVELVKSLIESVIGGTIQPREFTTRIQDVLKSQTQPHLLPFIEKTLPALRIALLNGQQTIEGIRYTGQAPTEFHNSQSMLTDTKSIKVTSDGFEEKYQSTNFSTKIEVDEPTSQQHVVIAPTQMMHIENSKIIFPQKTDQRNLEPISNLPSTSLNGIALTRRLMEQVPGCDGVDADVIIKISEVAESQLRELLLQLSEIAGHRLEPLKNNPMYQQVNDPRKQLKFLEEHDKQALIRQENVEKEALLKASKIKTKDNVQKAKDIKNADQEEKRNREANEAAIAALGGNRPKAWNRFDPMKAPIQQGMSSQPLRPRIRRVTIRDLQCALDCKNVPGNLFIKTQLAYGLFRYGNDQQQNAPNNM